jgi:hypothetical protein
LLAESLNDSRGAKHLASLTVDSALNVLLAPRPVGLYIGEAFGDAAQKPFIAHSRFTFPCLEGMAKGFQAPDINQVVT